MRKLDHDQIAMCCHSLNGLQVSPEGEAARDKLDDLIREADKLGKANIQMPVERARTVLIASQRSFTKDEYDRFIDRLVWAIGASPGGKLDEDVAIVLHADITNVLNSCARVSDPNKIIVERLVDLFEKWLKQLEDAPFDMNDFQKRCRGERV